MGGVLILVIGIAVTMFLRCYYLKKPRKTSQMSQVLMDDHTNNPSPDNYKPRIQSPTPFFLTFQ